MQSTFTGIEIGKRSLVASNQGLTTIGHNLANASTEGYSRQRVELNSFEPLYAPELNRENTPGQVGQGVMTERIERVRDQILEGRIVAQGSGESYWEMRDKYLLMLEQVYNEPTESSTRSLMDKFWDSWQELSLHPGEMAARQAVANRGETLIDSIHDRFRRLQATRDMLEGDVQATVRQANDFTRQIASLNVEISKSMAVGDNPNDLMDRRDLLVQKLSKILDITTDQRDKDEFVIHAGGLMIVQGKIARELGLSTGPQNEGYSELIWKESGNKADIRGGSLGALIELRDGDVRDEIQSLDTMTLTFIDLVNETHRSGYGLNGSTGIDFFKEYPFINNLAGNYDRNGDGIYDSSYVFRITGANVLDPREQIGLAGTIVLSGPKGDTKIQYFPSDTVEDLVSRINDSGAEISARLDRTGKLQLKATPASDKANPDFVLRRIEDSGQFLAGYAGILSKSGTEGAYDWRKQDAVLDLRAGGIDYAIAPLSHPSGWIQVNPLVSKDLTNLAAGFGENGEPASPGDGSAALAVAALRNNPAMIGRLSTFDDFFADAVANIGLKGEQAAKSFETQGLVMKELTDLRESISGVNIDEELSQMIKFQHGYAAAARFIANMNEMLDTLINRLGV